MKIKVGAIAGVLGLMASVSLVQAGYVGITIADPHGNKTFTPPNTGASGPFNPGLPEDNETEWNSISNQSWDLEEFAFDSSNRTLKMSGGFNFISGRGYGRDGNTDNTLSAVFEMGDVFIYVNTGVPYTVPPASLPLSLDHDGPWTGKDDWDYVIAFKRDSAGNILLGVNNKIEYAIKPNATVGSPGSATLTPGGGSNLNKNLPWKWNGTVSGPGLLTADYSTYNGAAQNTSNSDIWWNAISGMDLSSIPGLVYGDEIYFHTTMKCGNDVLWGRTTIVPDSGTTVALLGIGMIGLGFFRRRQG